MAKVRVHAAELHVRESVEDVMRKVSNADHGVQEAGKQVAGPGWIQLTDVVNPGRDLYVQVQQIGYVHRDK
jgi:hypothetical protein